MKKKKRWYKRPIRSDSVWLKKLRTFCQFYQVSVRYYRTDNESSRSGTAWSAEGKVSICLGDSDGNTSIQDVISTLCHEIGHCLDARNGKYAGYNSGMWVSKQSARFCIRHGYQAELHADFVGKGLMKRHFPDIPYISGYSRRGRGLKEDLKWFHKHYLSWYKDYLGGR